MAYSLLLSSTEACEKHWGEHEKDCAGFAQAVASELCILLPTLNTYDNKTRLNADLISLWITNYLPALESPFLPIPPGETAALQAMYYANKGDFVLAGITHEEANTARGPEEQTKHGHLAIVTPGEGLNGWPKGYWGSHPSGGKKNESLSKTFRSALKNKIHYFVVLRGVVETDLKLN